MKNVDLSRFAPRCNQVWEDMSKVDSKRRFCSSCDKKITDFRGMSKREVIIMQLKSDKTICGLYDDEIFKSPTSKDAFNSFVNLKKKSFALWLSSLFVTTTLMGQEVKENSIIKIEEKKESCNRFKQRIKIQNSYKKASIKDSLQYKIHGKIENSVDLIPTAGVLVYIRGFEDESITESDFDGFFDIKIPKECFKSDSITLKFTDFDGNENKRQISIQELKEKNILQITEDTSKWDKKSVDLIQNVFIGVVRRPPFFKRMLYKIKSFFK